MRKTLLVLIILFSFKLYSQEIIEFKKGEFEFYLSKDCQENECGISKIEVFKNGVFIQKIIPSENDFYSFIKSESIMEIEDMNFDNHLDFRIIKSIPAEYTFPYLYWIYNDKTELFEQNNDYEIIISPKFNYEENTITSNWCGYLRDCFTDYYKLIDGIPTLFERHFTKPNRNGTQQVEIWKTVNGKLKLIKTEQK
jgi:hypothetical protein